MGTKKRGGKGTGRKTQRPKKKSSLPSFGFTDDLLKSPPSGESTPAEAESEATPAEQEDAPKKMALPAFGFAEDLLQDLEGRNTDDDTPRPTPQAAGTSDAGTSDAAGTSVDAGSTAPQQHSGEERIFAFADDLETSFEEQKAAPVRLETWVTFDLADETFALPVDPVHEVVRPSTITRVPHAPYPIRGVTNLRGRVVPVIDLRLRLELPEAEIHRGSRVVVVGSRGRRLGLLVDAVHQVVHLDMDQVQTPPDDVMTVQSDYLSGVYHMGEDLILLLDVDRVLIIKGPVTSPPPPAAEAMSGGAA